LGLGAWCLPKSDPTASGAEVANDAVETRLKFWCFGFWAHLVYFIAGFMSYKLTPNIRRQMLIYLVLGVSFICLAFD
jgi:hypothetical protein